MKNAIFTSSDAKYGDFLIENWLASLKANVDLSNTDVIVLDYGFSEEQKKRLVREKVLVLPCRRDGHVVSLRFRDMARFLKKHSYDQVMTTDGGDIIFQTDLKELFESHPNDFRAVCEDFNLPFEAVFIDGFFSAEYEKKIRETIANKKMINAGVIVAPRKKFLSLCEEINREMLDKSAFGPDQIAINYILHRDGFVAVDSTYNFVVTTCETPFFIRNGVFYLENGKTIAIVHNAGGSPWYRPIENFGFGPQKNRLKETTYKVARMVTRAVHKQLSKRKGTKPFHFPLRLVPKKRLRPPIGNRGLRIAMFADTFFPTIDGVVSSMITTATELSKKGNQVMLFVPKPKTYERLPEFKEFQITWVRSVPFFAYGQYRVAPPFSFSAQKAFDSFDPDIVHCHTPFSMGWMGINFAKRNRIPIIATYHTLLPDFLMYLPIPLFNRTKLAKELAWEYTKFFYKKADLVTTPSREMSKELEKRRVPALFVSNPLEFRLFNQFAGTKKSGKEFRLVFFGRLSFEKNIEVLLQALKLLLDKKKKVRLIIVGNGPAEETLKKTVQELGIQKSVEFAGVLRGKELAKKVASCHCSLTASTIETQGLTILEGMAAGIPCIGADYLAIPASVKEGKNGFLFPPFHPETCAKKIEKLLESKALLKKLSKNAVETARPYSAEKVCEEWEKTYRELSPESD
jgi:glycosyltransferase involved in cell wall biosynthesis